MSRWKVALAVGVVAGAAVGLVLARGGTVAGPSTVSRGASGWWAAHAYLEARGTATSRLTGPVEELPAGAVLVLAFPWSTSRPPVAPAELVRHLVGGGDVVVAYAAGAATSPVGGDVAEALGIAMEPAETPPLGPVAWYRWTREARAVAPAPAAASAGLPSATTGPIRWRPTRPGARPLLVDDADRTVGIWWRRGEGRVVVVPAELFANARLGEPGNAALLESLRGWLGSPWVFDEAHHGLVAGTAGRTPTSARWAFDLFLLQVAVIYLAAVATLARRMGPAWREVPPITGTAAAFLRRVAGLHDRLGHHAPAAERLLTRAAALDGRLEIEPALATRARTAGPQELMDLAREIARRQRRPS